MSEEMNATPNEQAKPALPEGLQRRVEARIAAIKALYSNEVSDEQKDAATLALEMLSVYETSHYEESVKPERKFLKDLLSGVMEHRTMLDEKISAHLSSGWKIERLGSVLVCVLRVAVFELLNYEQRNAKIIINEYLDVAHGFCEEKDVKFVNGVLDKISKDARGL